MDARSWSCFDLTKQKFVAWRRAHCLRCIREESRGHFWGLQIQQYIHHDSIAFCAHVPAQLFFSPLLHYFIPSVQSPRLFLGAPGPGPPFACVRACVRNPRFFISGVVTKFCDIIAMARLACWVSVTKFCDGSSRLLGANARD